MADILITGANGFVGRPLCETLLASGHRVRAAVRSRAAAGLLPGEAKPVRIEQSVERADWKPHLDGVDVVIHLVGRTHVMNDKSADPGAEYRRVNVNGTGNLLHACCAACVRRFVYLSSIKAVGENANVAYDEQFPCRPENAYGRTKLEAERLVLDAGRQKKIEPVIVRSPLVYGAGVRGNLERLMRAIARGFPLPLGRARALRSLVYVRNLADALRLTATHPAAAGEVFHVADEPPISTRELVERLAAALGRPARLLPVPVGPIRLAGRLMGRTEEVERLFGPLCVSSQKIRTLLDWHPPFHVEHGLQEMAAWFRQTEKVQGDPETVETVAAMNSAACSRPAPRDPAAVPLGSRS